MWDIYYMYVLYILWNLIVTILYTNVAICKTSESKLNYDILYKHLEVQ